MERFLTRATWLRLLGVASCALVAAGCSRVHRELIVAKGSTTMLEIAQVWAEMFSKSHPDVGIAVGAGGTAGGINALLHGTTDLANCSRRPSPRERATAAELGIELVAHPVGHDGLAIWVHRDNPLRSITLAQLRAIYAEDGTARRWSDLGVALPHVADDTIVVVSRQSSSGTFTWFGDQVLGDDHRIRLGAVEPSSAKEVVALVGRSATAIGYAGLQHATPHVRAVPVVPLAGGPPVAPTIDSILDGTYPLARPLLVYTAGPPAGATAEYLAWIVGDDGQRLLQRNGYPPLRKL